MMQQNARRGANPPQCNNFNPGSNKDENARFQIAGLAPVSSASFPFRPNKLEVRSTTMAVVDLKAPGRGRL